ncbi:MAG: hypothetical protein K0R38_1523 [Polyangiaceae bacterium]|jgi:hypothetical protein|nr:hypothetical protein [Polyangiaceae bacterium]
MEARYARQQMLAAVGELGQARLASATYVVGSDGSLASEVEREYIARAGGTEMVAGREPSPAFAHAEAFRHADARDFAAGAWRALSQLKNVLEQAP